jgi:hypothetical protein
MPATAIPDTGHGASITFATTAWSGKIQGIPTNLDISVPRVDKSYLATSGEREYMAGDLKDLGEIEIDVVFEGVTGLPAVATGGSSETITMTYPLPGGGAAVAANVAGTGFITGVTYPPLQTNTLQVGKIRFTYDGATGPTYTATT